MTLNIKVDGILLKCTNNQDVVEVDESTVGKCLDDLIRQFPDLKEQIYNKNSNLTALVLNSE